MVNVKPRSTFSAGTCLIYAIKHLMTGHKGNSEFCTGYPRNARVVVSLKPHSPRSSMFPEASPRGTLRSRENKTHCFPRGQSLSVLLYLPTQK